jgi:predicted ribosome quality control (RQC) complex YloA/Tae2 family protein
VAWTSPINAEWILDQSGATADAWDRYTSLVTGPVRPSVLDPGARAQPNPAPFEERDLRERSLIDAFARSSELRDSPETAPAAETDTLADALAVVEKRRARTAGRIKRLREELAGAAADAEALRRNAGLLLARLHTVPRGAGRVRLDDWEGGTVEVELDPSLPAAANAEKMFESARRRERASATLPPLIARAEAELARVAETVARLEAGTADPAEVRSLATVQRADTGTRQAPALPYRRYRTSSGLEVRVGRSGRANDDLTFRHSSPEDVWLHARDVAGAHVVLRWPDRTANPPARDLAEAAVLAALHSRARTSGTVPVDWTRRKYVRKPRKAKPGLVTLERAKTVFVEPDEALERRLRSDEADVGG